MSRTSITTADLRKAATAVYLAAEESVAKELSTFLHWSADEVDRLRTKAEKLSALLQEVIDDTPMYKIDNDLHDRILAALEGKNV